MEPFLSLFWITNWYWLSGHRKGKAVLLYFHLFQKQQVLLQSPQNYRLKVWLLQECTNGWNKHIYWVYLDDFTRWPWLAGKRCAHAGPATPMFTSILKAFLILGTPLRPDLIQKLPHSVSVEFILTQQLKKTDGDSTTWCLPQWILTTWKRNCFVHI